MSDFKSSKCSGVFCRLICLLLLTLGIPIQAASAEIIVIEFAGAITSSEIVSKGRQGAPPGFYDDTIEYTPGTAIRGSFSINDALSDQVAGGEVDLFSADRFSDDRLNIPGFGADVKVDPDNLDPDRGGRDSQGSTFQGPYASVGFGTSPTSQLLSDPQINVRLQDSGADGDKFTFFVSSKGGGTQLPLFNFSLALTDPTGTAFPGSGSLSGSLQQLTDLLRPGILPFESATGGFRHRLVPRLSSVEIEAKFELTSLRLVRPRLADDSQAIELISQRSDESGEGADGTSWDPSLSADASKVAFSSDATNLVSDESNGSIRDVFVLNRATDEMRNLTNGGNGVSEDPVLSKDGNWLAFRTEATNLPTDVADSNGPIADIVLANVSTGALTLVTAGANAASARPSLSRDGRRLVFETLATNLASGNYQPVSCVAGPGSSNPCYKNVLLYDRVTQFSLSLTQGGMSDSRAPSISESGRHVAYTSKAFAPRSSLVVMDMDTGVRREVGSWPLTIDASQPYISANARWVTVLDTPYSPRTRIPPNVYLYDLQNDQEYFLGADSQLTGDFSSDERFLVFSSFSDRLVFPDTNGTIRDIYRLDLSTAPWSDRQIPLQNVERISIDGDAASGGPGTNQDGSIIVWDSTATNFANDNNDGLFDVFMRDLKVSNRVPVANAQSLTLRSGSSVNVVLTGFDPDGDTLQFMVQDDPTHGALSGVPPALTYTSAVGYSGTDSLSFVVQDSESSSAPALVVFTVEPEAATEFSLSATQRDDSRLIDIVATWPDSAIWTQVREYDGLTGVLWDGQATRWEGVYTPEPGSTSVSFNSRYWLPGITTAHDSIDVTVTLDDQPQSGLGITGFAWVDTDGDSRRDAEEAADSERVVTLYRCENPWGIAGNAVSSVIDGTFSIDGLIPGKYQLGTSAIGVTFSPLINDNSIASNGFSACFDVDGTSVQIGIGVVGEGGDLLDLSGFSWLDASNDGVRDFAEQPDVGREVTAYRCELPWGVAGRAMTDTNGDFVIANVNPGKYQFGIPAGALRLSPKANDNTFNANGFSDCLDFTTGSSTIGIGVVP